MMECRSRSGYKNIERPVARWGDDIVRVAGRTSMRLDRDEWYKIMIMKEQRGSIGNTQTFYYKTWTNPYTKGNYEKEINIRPYVHSQ